MSQEGGCVQCEWCGHPIDHDAPEMREATAVIGRLMPLHDDCAEDFDRSKNG